MLHIYKSIYCHAGRWVQFRCSEGKLKKYADYQDMVVVREFSDEGKSGKNVDGRPQFKEMLELIEAGTDDIDYVLVLSFLVLEEMPLMYLAHCKRCRISESI